MNIPQNVWPDEKLHFVGVPPSSTEPTKCVEDLNCFFCSHQVPKGFLSSSKFVPNIFPIASHFYLICFVYCFHSWVPFCACGCCDLWRPSYHSLPLKHNPSQLPYIRTLKEERPGWPEYIHSTFIFLSKIIRKLRHTPDTIGRPAMGKIAWKVIS